MAKRRLNTEVKLFIVKNLAEDERPSKVAALVKEKFGIEINRQTAQLYNPETVAGRDLSEPLRELYFATKKKYWKSVMSSAKLFVEQHIKKMQEKQKLS